MREVETTVRNGGRRTLAGRRAAPGARLRRGSLGAIILTLPLAVAVEIPEDSSLTQIRVAGGAGSYIGVIRDCEGNVVEKSDQSFADLAVAVDHKFGGNPVALGVCGGYLHDGRRFYSSVEDFASGGEKGSYYVNPTFGLAWGPFGISAGAAYLSRPLLDPEDITGETFASTAEWYPTFAMRIGRFNEVYFTSALLASFPFYSDGGYLEMGLGGAATPRVSLWGGVSLVGLTATALAGRVECRMSDRLYLDLGATLGVRDGDVQGGGNIGITYRVIH